MSTVGKLFVGLVLAGLVVLVLTSLPATAPAPGGETDTSPIKLGFIGPLTSGNATTYGEPMRNVVQLAVEEINAAGGVNGRILEVIYEDGECVGTYAAAAAQKLVNVDKVKVIFGGFCNSESLAAQPVTSAAKAFLISGGSSSPDLTDIDPLFARTYPSDATQGAVLAKIAFTDKEWKTMAFLQEQSDYPLGIHNAFKATFEPLGGKIVKEEFTPQATDFRSLLTKLKAAKPDALFINVQAGLTSDKFSQEIASASALATERILKQLQELKWQVPLIVSDAVIVSDTVGSDPNVVANNKTALEGALVAEFGVNPANPKFQALIAAYKQKYATEEPPHQVYLQTMYDAVYLVRDAIAQVGYDGEAVASWVRTVQNWEGASGTVIIGPDGDRDGGHVPKVIKDGKVETYVPPTPEEPSAD